MVTRCTFQSVLDFTNNNPVLNRFNEFKIKRLRSNRSSKLTSQCNVRVELNNFRMSHQLKC